MKIAREFLRKIIREEIEKAAPLRGMLVENFAQELQHSMLVNDITDAVVNRLAKTSLFRRGIPVSIVNRIEKYAKEILGHVYDSHQSITDAEDHGFQNF